VPRCAKSRMRRNETPKPIWIKFCMVVDIPDVVKYAKFGDHRLRGFWVAGGANFTLSHWLSSSPLQHSRTTVRACDFIVSAMSYAGAHSNFSRLGLRHHMRSALSRRRLPSFFPASGLGNADSYIESIPIRFSLPNRFFFDSIRQSDKFAASTLIFK